MPDLPTPQDATEAALFSESWDAVLSYADLCTSGSAAGRQLATEAFSRGVREARAMSPGEGRAPHSPAARDSAAAHRRAYHRRGVGGTGNRASARPRSAAVAPLRAGRAVHRAAPSAAVGAAALKDMYEADAALLWLVEVEALPLPDAARRLGLDPPAASVELTEVRGLFRDRCRRNHLDTPMDAECRSYARLLDAVTARRAPRRPRTSRGTSPPAWRARRPRRVCGCTAGRRPRRWRAV